MWQVQISSLQSLTRLTHRDTDLPFVLIVDGKDKQMKLAELGFNIGLHRNGFVWCCCFCFCISVQGKDLKKKPTTPQIVCSLLHNVDRRPEA